MAWAVEQRYEIINLSLGAGRRNWALAFHELCDRAYFANCFIVTAANNLPRESYPSLFASVASVAANTTADPLRYHVNPDPPTEFLARGMDIEVPWLDHTTIVTTGNSFAAPHISAFAALIRADHPELRPFQVKAALWASAANVREAAARAGPLPAPATWRAPSVMGRNASPAPPTARPVPSTVAARSAPAPGAGGPVGAGDIQRLQVERLLPDHRIGALVRRDPWGAVYEAEHEGRPRLARCLDPGLAAVADVRERFATVVRLVAGLRHRHLLEVLDLREDDSCTVMVVVRCPSDLAAVLREGPLSPPAACAAVLSTLRGLEPAHAAGLYHGDLRPGAVLVGDDGRLVVSDVGIAAALTSDIRTSNAHDPGSWRYLAPEQFDAAPIGPYTDVHAAGLLLVESLTGGELPYPDVPTLGALVAQRARDIPRPVAGLVPGLPPGLAELADRAVSLAPADRPATVAAFARSLETVADASFGPGWHARQPFPLEPGRERTPPS
ncbi:MAG: protein kinase [Acidimicrobiales bacterium]